MINRNSTFSKKLSSSTVLIFLFSTFLYSQQFPFNDTLVVIPGQIEAENFDTGGEGIAYHDFDSTNNGGMYRDTGVDIEPCAEGGFNVGWIEPDEWLEYSVDVTEAGRYSFEIRVASESIGGTFHIEFEGIDVSGPINFAATGGWQNWITVIVDSVLLTAGPKVMRFVSESSGYNVNHINIIQLEIFNPPSVSIISPLDNTEFFLGDDVEINVDAVDSLGSVELVEFFVDDEKIAEDLSYPYSYLWQQPEIGNYDLTAVATDNAGARGTSNKVDISVNFPEYDYQVDFSEQSQFQNSAFNVTLSTMLTDAFITYTLDGSNPLTSATAQTSAAPFDLYVDPNGTDGGRGATPGVVIRAVVIKNDLQQSRVATKTYLFFQEVKNQDWPGGAWPDSNINDQILYYHVNQEVVNDVNYAGLIDDALLDIPSISLVTDLDNLFDSQQGIYVNAQFHGIDWEREVSVELLNPDGTPGFQIDAGIRIRGGWSRHDYFPKHSFRLFFREEYGDNKLVYPLFGDEGVDEFKKMDLRTSQNYAWSNGGIYENTMNRDVFSRDLQAQMKQPYTRSRYYHLYINGMYWGLFQSQERPEANFAESYLGGNDNDYDVVKVDIGEDWSLYEVEATDGNLDAWGEVWEASEAGFTSNTNYFGLEGKNDDGTPDIAGSRLVDIDNLIDYMLIIFYTGNFDAPVSKFRGEASPNNFYAIYDRTANEGFKFLAHDAEHTLLLYPSWPGDGIDEDRVNIEPFVDRFEIFHPQWLHIKLAENQEYRMRFADRIYKHFFNDGVMKADKLSALFNKSAADINMAIIGESMRWGDLERSKFNAWQPAIDLITNDYFPYRGDIVLQQFKQAGLYPNLLPPTFTISDTIVERSTVQISSQTTIVLDTPNDTSGFIIYTLDGTDPRAVGGGIAASAFIAGSSRSINISGTTKIMARMKDGSNWSALHEITLNVSQNLASLNLTEIHYHPLDEGLQSGRLYEFLELQNAGLLDIDLSLIGFINGVDFTFPSGTALAPGDFIVIASNAVSFEQRYGFAPFGQFTGQLDNSGERLSMADAAGDTLISVRYNDKAPWPVEADGSGPSLVWTNQTENGDLNDALNWAASFSLHGSPGTTDLTTSISENNNSLAIRYNLQQNYPNPFNPLTRIKFSIPKAEHVKIDVFNTLGQRVITLLDKALDRGLYDIEFDARNLASGIYYYKIEAGNFQNVKKMILLK